MSNVRMRGRSRHFIGWWLRGDTIAMGVADAAAMAGQPMAIGERPEFAAIARGAGE